MKYFYFGLIVLFPFGCSENDNSSPQTDSVIEEVDVSNDVAIHGSGVTQQKGTIQPPESVRENVQMKYSMSTVKIWDSTLIGVTFRDYKMIPKLSEFHKNYGMLIKENHEDDVYGEKIYQVTTEPNGNLKLEEMMSRMMGKIDGINGTSSQTGTDAIEVDIQREIAPKGSADSDLT